MQEYFLMALSQPRSTYRIDEGPGPKPARPSKEGSEGGPMGNGDLDPDDMSDAEVHV